MTMSGTMGSNGQYPSAAGFSMAQTSQTQANFKTAPVMTIFQTVGGTLGTTPVIQGQVKTLAGNWVNVPALKQTAVGMVVATVEGTDYRIDANLGTSPGSGANTPTYEFEAEHVNIVGNGI
jgi:hypothetical protein